MHGMIIQNIIYTQFVFTHTYVCMDVCTGSH